MFTLHDSTRRLLCLVVFLGLGLAPTLWTARWCLGRNHPALAANEAQRLSLSLGLRVGLTRFEYLRPDAVAYYGLQLADPETGRPLARCESLRCTRATSRDAAGQSVESLHLVAKQCDLEADGLTELGRLVQRLLQSRTAWSSPHGRLEATAVSVRSPAASVQLRDVQGQMGTLPSGGQAEIVFRLPGTTEVEPVRIRLGRNRQMNPPATGFELSTGGTAIACRTLALGLPLFARFGAQSRWSGTLWANQMSEDWQGELTGRLLDLDLAGLFSQGFPHKLSGTANLDIQVARFRQGRLEEAAGVVLAGPGVISRSLLDAAVTRLTLLRGATPAVPSDLVPYRELAAGFLLDARGLALRGRGGAILVDNQGPLLGDPATQSLPLASVLQLLVPESDVSIPASRQAERLMQWLPLPEALAPAVTAQR